MLVGVVLGAADPRHGRRRTHIVSLVAAGLIAVWWLSRQDFFLALWFGYFAVINYQILQSIHDSYHYAEDADWWRR